MFATQNLDGNNNTKQKRRVIYGFLGSTLDRGDGERRWEKWRPTVAVCSDPVFRVDEYHMIYDRQFSSLAKAVLADIRTVSPHTNAVPRLMRFDDPWDFEEVYDKLAELCTAENFKQDECEYLFNITTGTHAVQICAFLLTEAGHFPGKILQSSPEPRTGQPAQGTFSIIDLNLSRYDKIASRFAKVRERGQSFLKAGIATRNPEFNRLIERIEAVALKSTDPILLLGPTGAGKTQLASRIFELRKNRGLVGGNFVPVNCATLRADNALSTLFGHNRGAFTGAVAAREGLLRRANRGLLFLDEIGELGMDEQAMLLRAIETGHFLPMGSDTETESRFQLICGTNRDLRGATRNGTFREDLLSRIDMWAFTLPALRERIEDIEPNIDFELSLLTEETGRAFGINSEARERYLSFATSGEALWTANFRDLRSSLRRMATLAESGRINLADVETEIGHLRDIWETVPKATSANLLRENEVSQTPHAGSHDKDSGVLGPQNMDSFDRFQLEAVLKVCRECSSIAEAGRRLFETSRLKKSTVNDTDRLRKYLANWGIRWGDWR